MGYFKNLDANAANDTPLQRVEPSDTHVAAVMARLYAKCDALIGAHAQADETCWRCGDLMVYREEGLGAVAAIDARTCDDCLALREASASPDPDDTLNDADILAATSDHSPDDRIEAEHDAIRRDGQRWAAGLTTEEQLMHAAAIARSLESKCPVTPGCPGKLMPAGDGRPMLGANCPSCNLLVANHELRIELLPERRAFCEGVQTGLANGYDGLSPDTGKEDAGGTECAACGGERVVPNGPLCDDCKPGGITSHLAGPTACTRCGSTLTADDISHGETLCGSCEADDLDFLYDLERDDDTIPYRSAVVPDVFGDGEADVMVHGKDGTYFVEIMRGDFLLESRLYTDRDQACQEYTNAVNDPSGWLSRELAEIAFAPPAMTFDKYGRSCCPHGHHPIQCVTCTPTPPTPPSMVFDIDWPMPDDLARALVGLPNTGDFGQGIEAFNVRSFSDLDVLMHEAFPLGIVPYVGAHAV